MVEFKREAPTLLAVNYDEVIRHVVEIHGIRELQNAIERGVIMTPGSVLSHRTVEHLRRSEVVPIRANAAAEPVGVRTLADAERAHITATLNETNWIVGERRGAAAQLGLPRTTLIARMQRLGISHETARNRLGQAAQQLVRVMGGLPRVGGTTQQPIWSWSKPWPAEAENLAAAVAMGGIEYGK